MIKIELNDREVRQVLDRLARRVNNLTPALHDVGQALMEGSRQRISEGRDWQGRAFAPNSPFTLARKRGTKPLVDTGNLVGSRLHYRAGRDFVEVGSSAVQAAVLQFGAKRGQFDRGKRGAPLPWGDIPPRPFLPIEGADNLPESASRMIGEIIAGYLSEAS